MKPGKAIHPSNGIGVAPDAATSPQGVLISFDQGPNRGGQTTAQVIVTNSSAANPLEISFANGKDKAWFAIAPNTTVVFPVICHNCRVRGASGATANYSLLGIVA
jgi:hypothetical protein